MRSLRLIVGGVLCAAAPSLWAGETCKYVDAEGRITFANVPVKNARKLMCFDPMPLPKPAPKPPSGARPASAADTPSAKVDGETQRKRDTDRRRILERELEDEQRLLEQAMRSLQDAAPNPGTANAGTVLLRAQPMLEAIARHERNIESIRRELSAIR